MNNLIVTVSFALALDYLLGEPKSYHPLVGYGCLVEKIEAYFNVGEQLRQQGVIAWCLAVIPIFLVVLFIDNLIAEDSFIALIWSAVILYLAIGWQSLMQHARDILHPLIDGDLAKARLAVAKIVSRDSNVLDQAAVARAATESVLENGADAIFAPIFWFCVLGVPGVVLYRLCNTLDAMWGYKTERYKQFGWMAAKSDDCFNWVPARLTALTYALLGNRKLAIECWRKQGTVWKSPNAGPVMSSGAGSLNVSLGGAEFYHGELQQRPLLGPQQSPTTIASSSALEAACTLVNKSIAVWVIVILLIGLI